VAWDLNACGFPLPPLSHDSLVNSNTQSSGMSDINSAPQQQTQHDRFFARYDRVFVCGDGGGGHGRVCAVRATLPENMTTNYPLLPNAEFPSDHLPIGISIEL
jgi:hypothetical protein